MRELIEISEGDAVIVCLFDAFVFHRIEAYYGALCLNLILFHPMYSKGRGELCKEYLDSS